MLIRHILIQHLIALIRKQHINRVRRFAIAPLGLIMVYTEYKGVVDPEF